MSHNFQVIFLFHRAEKIQVSENYDNELSVRMCKNDREIKSKMEILSDVNFELIWVK